MNDKKDEIVIKYIETTSKCNYRCPICVKRTRNCNMDMEEFYKIVDKNLDLFHKKPIWLDFNGEPLVDPYFFERVKYMHKKGLKTRISTNGDLLNNENIVKMIDSGMDYIVVSVGTLNPKKYEEIRGIDNLSKVLTNLTNLKKYIDKVHSKTEVQAVMIDTGNDLNREEFINYFHNQGINVAFHNFTNRAHSIEKDLKPKNRNLMEYKRGECKGLRHNIIILSNCEVVTCCCDFLAQNSLGNLRDYDYSVKKLVENGKLDKLISNLKNHIYEGACKDCTDWIYYQEGATEEYVTVYPVNERK